MRKREDLLHHLWTEVINSSLRDGALDNEIANCEREPADAPFSDTAEVLKRLLALGANRDDLALLQRSAAYEAVFQTLYALDDPGVDDDEVFGLHENLLGCDPSGMEGRPGSAEAVRK